MTSKENTENLLRYIVNLLAVVLVALLVYSVIEFKKKNDTYPFEARLKIIGREFSKFIKGQKTNLGMSISPLRRRPLTCIQREEALRQYLPKLFAEFSETEWDKFWELIYDPIVDKRTKVSRYRSREEVEENLRRKYPQFLGELRESQWQEIWAAARISWADMERKEQASSFQ